jgi:hypothetical protein
MVRVNILWLYELIIKFKLSLHLSKIVDTWVFQQLMLLKRYFSKHLSANIAQLFLEIEFGLCALNSMEFGFMRLFANWSYDLESNFILDFKHYLFMGASKGLYGLVTVDEIHRRHLFVAFEAFCQLVLLKIGKTRFYFRPEFVTYLTCCNKL